MSGAKRLWAVSGLLVLAVSLLPGCGNDGGPGNEATPPDIPPLSTFLMDFTDFVPEQATLEGGPAPFEPGYTRNNWVWASTNVLVWNTLITVGLAVPVLAYIESFSHEPTRQPDGSWLWDYNFVVQDVVHLAELYGRVVRDEVRWEMYISKEGEYTDFLWYSGQSDLAGTEGTWTLYTSPVDPDSLLGIEWHRNVGTLTRDIRYTNIVPGGPENGGYIFYGIMDGSVYDAFYDIYNKGQENHTEIEWNRSTMAGRVSDPNHFGDEDWHCWDSVGNDIDCPASR
jgi:hypothetical protein